MSTYYEALKITPSATTAEIEVAYDAQYNRWRRLVTHHDPEMAHRANLALRWLVQIRVMLLDPGTRDASGVQQRLITGFGGILGGIFVFPAIVISVIIVILQSDAILVSKF